MSHLTTKIIRLLGCRRGPIALASVALVGLVGCFGPPAMKYDIDAYNRDAVLAEQEMLLFNIGRLHNDQPPHFMILSNISQTRAFSASASFQWTHFWNNLLHLPGSTPTRSVTTQGSDAYQVGPLMASSSENPTITFVPIQGSDFGLRFESPLTDKFTYFLEDSRWSEPHDERDWLVRLFAQSLKLDHGDARCPAGLYYNRWAYRTEAQKRNYYYFDKFSECVDHITSGFDLNYVWIDANHLIPTKASSAPQASDVITALQNNYKWISLNRLTTTSQSITTSKDTTTSGKPAHETTRTDTATTSGNDFVLANPVRIPAWLDYNPFSVPAPKREQQLTYGDTIVSEIWPVPQDYFYVELRNGAGADTAERLCHSKVAPAGSQNDEGSVVCGYLKIGNLLQIMQRLGKMSCTSTDSAEIQEACIFGVGSSAPTWADSSASYVYRTRRGINLTESVWVPAHDPRIKRDLAERDRYIFLMLYKIYQMSLVDTSKLVTGAPAITIPK